MIERLFLFFMALMFLAFGAWSLFDPVGMTAALGVSLGGPNGPYEVRGIYGGISLAAALLCGLGALRTAERNPALIFVCVYMGGYTFARVAGVLLGDKPTLDFLQFATFEVVTFLIDSFLLVKPGRR